MGKRIRVISDWERKFAFLPKVVHSEYSSRKEVTTEVVIWWGWYEEKWDGGWMYRREIGQKEGISWFAGW